MATPVRIMRRHIQSPGNLASLVQEIRDQHPDVADVTTCIYEVEITCESLKKVLSLTNQQNLWGYFLLFAHSQKDKHWKAQHVFFQ